MTRYKIVISVDVTDSPQQHEFMAAVAVAEYFRSNVTFIRPTRYRTPDFDVDNTRWELKSPMGSSARTIENNMRSARGQSVNLIIDLSRIKMNQHRATARINFFLSKPNKFERVLIITKARRVIEIL